MKNFLLYIIIIIALLTSAAGCNPQSGYRIHGPNYAMEYYDYSEYPRNKRAHECEGKNYNPDCRNSNRRHHERRHHGHKHHRRHHR
jgi:hypothetical protein